MTFDEPPLTPLPEGPPAPPVGRTVSRATVDDFLRALGYDPRWVISVRVDPRGVTVNVLAGELYPAAMSVRHTYAEPEPIPEPGPRR